MTGTELENARQTILQLRHQLELASLQRDHSCRKVTELMVMLDKTNTQLRAENKRLQERGGDLSHMVVLVIGGIGTHGDDVPEAIRDLVPQLLDAHKAWMSMSALHDRALKEPTASEATADLLDLLDDHIVGCAVTKVEILRKMCRLREAIVREACGREAAMT